MLSPPSGTCPQDQVEGEFQFPFPSDTHVAAIVEPENKSIDASNTMKAFIGIDLRGLHY